MERNMIPKAQILQNALYPIKVNNVKQTEILDEKGGIRVGVTERIGQENETTIGKILWLSKKDVLKAYGSMMVYLIKATNARKLLEEGFFHVGRKSGFTSAFERRDRPEQCYNCQQVGHKAFQCQNFHACGRFATEGHSHCGCNEAIPKCIPCGEPHESFSRNYPKLYPVRHE
jgi:hypothetical protein